MKEENKDFYTEGCDTEAIDLQLEAFDELVESMMLEALKHQTAAEKLDAKKYRMSTKGKKAIAKYLKKAARAGYKVDKLRSKLMKKVAAFAKRESVDEAEFEELFDINSAELCEAVFEVLEAEDLAEFDAIFEDVSAFNEACKVEDDEIDPETGEECDDEELEEGFKHMSATAKTKAKKYRMSAAGKRARKNYLRNLKRRGGRVDKQRSKLMKKVGAFARHETEDLEFMREFNLSEAELEILDSLIASAMMNAQGILDSELSEEELSFLESDTLTEGESELTIEVPFEDKEEVKSVEVDGVEVVEVDEENGIAFVKGSKNALEAFLEALGYDEDVEDLVAAEELDEMQINHMTAADKLLARKYRMSAAGKKAIKKYLKKRSRAGYKVNKALSKKMSKVAQFRREAIEESLNAQFATTPLFESLNEGESNELKGIVFNAVTSILDQSYEKIAEDVTNEYEAYMTEEAMPELCRVFEDYSAEIVRNLNENVEEYLDYVASEIVESLEDKNLIVKSQKSEMLESFSEELLELIKDKLNIIPEQEDMLVKSKDALKESAEELQDAKVELIKMRKMLEAQERELYVLKNTPVELSELQKENLDNYVNDVLSEAEDFEEFKNYFDKAVSEATRSEQKVEKKIVESKKEESPKNFSSLFESLERMGRI